MDKWLSRWAHNPEVDGSKPSSASSIFYIKKSVIYFNSQTPRCIQGTQATRRASIVLDPNGGDAIGIDYFYMDVYGNGTSAMTASTTIPTTDLSGTITNAQLANSSITIGSTAVSLGGTITT